MCVVCSVCWTAVLLVRCCFIGADFLPGTWNCSISRQSLSLILSSLFLSFPVSMACVCTRVSGVKCGCVPPSAVEGEYNPWERELQQGLWLQRLSDEEDSGTRQGTQHCLRFHCPQERGRFQRAGPTWGVAVSYLIVSPAPSKLME